MRVTSLILLMITALAGCEKKATVPPQPPPAPPPAQTVDVTFFYNDGTAVTKTVPFLDPVAAEAAMRPILATAFGEPEEGPRVLRWLINDTRPFGIPTKVKNGNVEVQLVGQSSTYREYRVVLAFSNNGEAITQLKRRSDPKNADWMTFESSNDPEQVFDRAIELLSEDLASIRATATFADKPLFKGPTTTGPTK